MPKQGTMNGSGTGGAGTTYDLHERPHQSNNKASVDESHSLDYSSNVDSESYYRDGGGSSVTGGAGLSYNQDATQTVHQMHLALMFLLSNPDEFKKALHAHPPRGATTLAEWNAEYEEDEESVMTSGTAPTPLPFVVFADDAEVVLPQAHTASQLFGIEKVEGIELEAAAGIPALSQLFLRWLALMPGGDHLNIIEPPGLTVMRIAGGRYRVTAAHRVVWTWMNEFATLAEDGGIVDETLEKSHSSSLQIGDLVSMTIVDVFETDNQGKLLSYCPTFDNRAVYKTNQTTERLRKSSGKFLSMLGRAGQAVAKSDVNRKAAEQLNKMGLVEKAKHVAENVKHRVDVAVLQYSTSPARNALNGSEGSDAVTDSKGFEQALAAAEEAAMAEGKNSSRSKSMLVQNEKTPTFQSPRDGAFSSEDHTAEI